MNIIDSQTIFQMLLEVMSQDNGFQFTATERQTKRAMDGIAMMRAFGVKFKLSDANNLDGPFWVIAAGDEDEMKKRYGNVPGFQTLSKVLNEIFNISDQ